MAQIKFMLIRLHCFFMTEILWMMESNVAQIMKLILEMHQYILSTILEQTASITYTLKTITALVVNLDPIHSMSGSAS